MGILNQSNFNFPMHQSLWPLWLPYPISWARACANVAVFSIIAQGVASSARTADEPLDMIPIVLTGLWMHFTIIVLGHHCIAKLRRQKSGWFPSWQSWLEGLNGTIVLVVQLLSTSIFVAFFAAAIDLRSSEGARTFVAVTCALLVGVAAYLYHYDFLVRQRRATAVTTRRQRHHKPTPRAPQSIDPVDLELDQLRGEMGLNQMKHKRNHRGNP